MTMGLSFGNVDIDLDATESGDVRVNIKPDDGRHARGFLLSRQGARLLGEALEIVCRLAEEAERKAGG